MGTTKFSAKKLSKRRLLGHTEKFFIIKLDTKLITKEQIVLLKECTTHFETDIHMEIAILFSFYKQQTDYNALFL